MKIYREKLQITTRHEFDIIDITTDVEKVILESGIQEGWALVYSPHTTCGVVLNEKESGLLQDIQATLQRLVPQLDAYVHDDFEIRTENMHEDENKNAHAHLRQLIGGRNSEYIPISEGLLMVGEWQRVMFVEFDCSRERQALIQICGM